MKKLLLTLLLIPFIATAQKTQKEEKTYPVQLTIEQWSQVLQGLQTSKLEAFQSNVLVFELQKQLQKQIDTTKK